MPGARPSWGPGPPAPVAAIPHDHRPNFHARTLVVDGTPRPYFDFLVGSSLATLTGLPAAVGTVLALSLLGVVATRRTPEPGQMTRCERRARGTFHG